MAHAMAAVEEEDDVFAIFAVSLNERLLKSFEPMGFERVDRAELPEAWRRGYDPERPSIVYARRLRT